MKVDRPSKAFFEFRPCRGIGANEIVRRIEERFFEPDGDVAGLDRLKFKAGACRTGCGGNGTDEKE